MQPIIEYFQQYLPLTEAEQALILARVKPRNIKRRQRNVNFENGTIEVKVLVRISGYARQILF